MKRIRHNEEPTSYWKSMTDVMAALLLILILLLILFMLRAVNDAEPIEESSEADIGAADDIYIEHNEANRESHDDQSGGGGGGGDNSETEPTEETTEPTEETIADDEGKCAVLVIAKDVDSQRNIMEENIRFELRKTDKTLVTLNTYYPQQINYREFATQPDGTFYFPEKLELDEYRLINLTPPTGYELLDPVAFILPEALDWPSPFIVQALFGPEKNSIYIQEVTEDGHPLKHSSQYDVYAATDIITADGTLRYHKDEFVTSFRTNDNGYGFSDEIFLGKYRVVQIVSEQGYAINEDTLVTVASKQAKEPIQDVICEKTSISVQLVDELDEGLPLHGATYEVRNDKNIHVRTMITDASGFAEIEDLDKDTNYYIMQTASSSSHFRDEATYTFHVDENGLIDGKATAQLYHTNRVIKLEIEVVDRFLRKPLANHIVEIFNSENVRVASFTTTKISKTIEGLTPGQYTLVCDGKKQDVIRIEVENTAEIQSVVISLSTQTGVVLVVIVGIGLLTAIVLVIYRRKKRKKGDDSHGAFDG